MKAQLNISRWNRADNVSKAYVRIEKNDSYKVGMDEIPGLKEALLEVMNPIKEALSEKIYWSSEIEINDQEYKSRDGFSAYPDNCGGLQICEVIPQCESYEFDFLNFGEYEASDIEGHENMTKEQLQEAIEEAYQGDTDHLDAIFRCVMKFEGFDERGNMIFYFFLEGGNGDAPYFRQGRQSTIISGEFKAKTLKDIKKKSAKHINKVLKLLK